MSNVNSTAQNRLKANFNELINNNIANDVETQLESKKSIKILILNFIKSFTSPIKEQSLIYLTWLAVLTIFYLYNLVTITLRFAFGYDGNYIFWSLIDYLADVIYLIDIFMVKIRLKFIKNGLWVTDYKSMAFNYFKSFNFLVTRLH